MHMSKEEFSWQDTHVVEGAAVVLHGEKNVPDLFWGFEHPESAGVAEVVTFINVSMKPFGVIKSQEGDEGNPFHRNERWYCRHLHFWEDDPWLLGARSLADPCDRKWAHNKLQEIQRPKNKHILNGYCAG